MKRATGRQPSIQSVINLLQNPEFCQDAQQFIQSLKPLRTVAASPEEWERLVGDLVQPFRKRWGVVPPTSGELLDADPRRGPIEAISSGRWGIILVSTDTTDREIRARIKTIRGMIRKQHRDALDLRRVQLARWLEEFQEEFPHFTRPAIAGAVFGRRKGLRRPTKTEAIRALSMDEEQRLKTKYREAGIPEDKIDARIYRKLRGSEARASAALRMSQRRHLRRLEQLNAALGTPTRSEPLSHALTHLFRALPDEDGEAVKQRAQAVEAAWTAAYPNAQSGLPRAIGNLQWGLVLVFPWTTDADVRARVQAIRVGFRSEREGRDGITRLPEEPIDPSPCDALLLLFQALADDDELKLNQIALMMRASFLKASTP